MRQHNEFHVGYALVSGQQAAWRAEREGERMAAQGRGARGRGQVLGGRVPRVVRQVRRGGGVVLCVVLLHLWGGSSVAAEHTVSSVAGSAACVAAVPSGAAISLPAASDGRVRLPRNYPIPQ
jgi:hypothetical protein